MIFCFCGGIGEWAIVVAILSVLSFFGIKIKVSNKVESGCDHEH